MIVELLALAASFALDITIPTGNVKSQQIFAFIAVLIYQAAYALDASKEGESFDPVKFFKTWLIGVASIYFVNVPGLDVFITLGIDQLVGAIRKQQKKAVTKVEAPTS